MSYAYNSTYLAHSGPAYATPSPLPSQIVQSYRQALDNDPYRTSVTKRHGRFPTTHSTLSSYTSSLSQGGSGSAMSSTPTAAPPLRRILVRASENRAAPLGTIEEAATEAAERLPQPSPSNVEVRDSLILTLNSVVFKRDLSGVIAAAATAVTTTAAAATTATATTRPTLTAKQQKQLQHKKRRDAFVKIATGVGAVLLGSFIVPGLMGAAPVWAALAVGAVLLVAGMTLWIVFARRDKHHPKGTPNKAALCRAARAHGMCCRELKGAAGAAARRRLRAFNPEAYDRIMRGEKVNLLNPGSLEAGRGVEGVLI